MSNPLLQRQPPLIGRYWLVLALGLVLLPHLSRLPAGLAIAASSVIIWRMLRDYHGWPLPGKVLRSLLTVSGIGAILLVFNTILGREAGSALLSILLSLKLLELRSLRDALLVVFLGYFLVIANFLFDDSIFTGLYMFVVVLALSASLLALNHPAASVARTPFYLKQAGVLLLQAVPIMVLMFVLFPRIDAPLWRIPEPDPQARTGLSDEMSPGDITNLVESDELVFRVEFTGGGIPAADQLYWRGPVLWQTDGRRWLKLSPQQLAHISRNVLRYQPLGKPVSYTVMLEPQRGPWLFSLDLPAAQPVMEGGSHLLPDFQLLSEQGIKERVRYSLSSATSYNTGELEPIEREYALLLPEQANPLTRELAQRWRASFKEDSALVNHALDYLRTNPFFYTRQPAALGTDPVDQFLFSTREGFCEHYSSAFVTLMRAAGIPSRVVTGYQGGDFNPVGRFLEIRQNRAHAWAEVWLAGNGWVRVDPTAVIPPERVKETQDTNRFRSTTAIDSATFTSRLLHDGLKKLQLGWSAMNYAWSVWVIGFDSERQRALMKQWGMDKLGLRSLLSILLIAVGIAFVLIALVVLDRHSANTDPIVHHYRRFCRRLEKAGISCPAHEGPQQLCTRATAALPHHASTIRDIIAAYIQLRYGHNDAIQFSTFKQRVDRFRP